MSVTVRPFRGADEAALIRLWNASMTHDPINAAVLRTRVLLMLSGAGADDICLLVAVQGERIVGCCQQRRERFGPFGVDPALRSQGVGRVLLFRCLAEMLAI
jgi:ribosomal protein S18 acetylase RimI-like enzyme